MPIYESSKRRLTWPNGAIATLYNGTEPEQLRGPAHDAAWIDELAKFAPAQDVWDQLQFGLRLGAQPRVLITTTPKPTRLSQDPNCDGQRCRDLRLRNTGRYRGMDQEPLTLPQQRPTSSRRASGPRGRRSFPLFSGP